MFSLRVSQIRVHNNHTAKPFLGGHPGVDVELFSIVSTNSQGIKGIDSVVNASDLASLQTALKGALSATVNTMTLPQVHDNTLYPLGGTTGWEVCSGDTEPDSIEWIFGIMKASSQPGAATNSLFDLLTSDPRIATLSGIASIIVPGVTPAIAASTKVLQTVGQLFNAIPGTPAGPNLLGALHVSLNRAMHYPTGFFAPTNVPDPSNTVLLDYVVQYISTPAPAVKP
ncbi:MAG TPA: hypothetical protein VGO93_01955 [Candidatus Xenobia bacterium]|jgi:hypothetical protein